jgi:hypothetical protein
MKQKGVAKQLFRAPQVSPAKHNKCRNPEKAWPPDRREKSFQGPSSLPTQTSSPTSPEWPSQHLLGEESSSRGEDVRATDRDGLQVVT